MSIGILHLHVTVVIFFLILLLFKVVLLFSGKKELLKTVRDKTRVLEMIIGVLILATGIYLIAIEGRLRGYVIIKILSLLAAIPLGIIGFKKDKKFMALVSLLLIIYAYGVGETKSPKFKRSKFNAEKRLSGSEEHVNKGAFIYKALCIDCHGPDGDKGLFKAGDLGESDLSREEKVEMIQSGKGAMRGYKDELTDEEVNAVVDYIEGFE